MCFSKLISTSVNHIYKIKDKKLCISIQELEKERVENSEINDTSSIN